MPGSAAQTSGMALTQWLAVATTPGFRCSPSAIVWRLQSFEGEAHGGVAGDLDLEAFAAPTEIPVRFQVLLAHQPVDRRRDDRLAVERGPASGTGVRPRFPR